MMYFLLLPGQTVDITPREAVRRIGDQLSVMCKVPYPIDSCRLVGVCVIIWLPIRHRRGRFKKGVTTGEVFMTDWFEKAGRREEWDAMERPLPKQAVGQ